MSAAILQGCIALGEDSRRSHAPGQGGDAPLCTRQWAAVLDESYLFLNGDLYLIVARCIVLRLALG